MNTFEQEIEELRRQLAIKERELAMCMALDHIRDHETDLEGLVQAIAEQVTATFDLSLCLVYLLDREQNRLVCHVQLMSGSDPRMLDSTSADDLANRAAQLRVLKAQRVVDWLPNQTLSERWQALHLAAMPVWLTERELLGVMLLFRPAEFTEDDLHVLTTSENIIDSAVIQGYQQADLTQHHRELEVIYRIDHIRDQRLPFDEMLQLVVEEVRRAVHAHQAYIFLYHRADEQLDLRAATPEESAAIEALRAPAERLARRSLSVGRLMREHESTPGVRSAMALPLILEQEVIGVLVVLNTTEGRRFDTSDQRLLQAIGSQMDTAIFESMEQRRLRAVLGRSVDPQVMRRLLDMPDVDFLRGERMLLSVLYADLRGSTHLAETTDPATLVDFINDYLGRMAEVVLGHGATLDKFVGDEVMALVGAPFPREDHALVAVKLGLAMQQTHEGTVVDWQRRGLTAPQIGVGIATGELTVGEFGYHQRTDFTVMGPAANLGARLCSAARGGEVLICDRTYAMVKHKLQATPVTGLQLKGIEGAQTAYSVQAVIDAA